MKHKSTYRAIVLGLVVLTTVGIGVFSGVREGWGAAPTFPVVQATPDPARLEDVTITVEGPTNLFSGTTTITDAITDTIVD